MRKVGKVNFLGEQRVQTINNDPSMTVQSDAHLADINNILAQFAVGQGLEVLDEAKLAFLDVSAFGDYQDVMNEVLRAERTFMALHPKVRLIFNNSVEEFLDTAHDDDKRAALVEAGFLKSVADSPPQGQSKDATETSGDPTETSKGSGTE